MGSGGCEFAGFMCLRFFHIMIAIPCLCLLGSYGNPAHWFMREIEIAFLSVTGISILETLFMAFAPLCLWKRKQWNPVHRLVLAVVVIGLGIALIVRTADLDTPTRERVIPRCSFTMTEGRDRKGRKTTVATVTQDQPPCILYAHRMVAAALALLSGLIYFVTGFKCSMPRPGGSVSPSASGRIISVWTPGSQMDQNMAAGVAPPFYPQQPIPYTQHYNYNQYTNSYGGVY